MAEEMRVNTKLKKSNRDKAASSSKNPMDRFLLGGQSGPIEDSVEFDKLVNSLPPEQKEFVTVATRFAKLWEYLSEHNIELPSDLSEAIRELPSLAHKERVALLERINQVLMECEHDANQGPDIRQ